VAKREELLAAVNARIDEALRYEDLSLLLEPDAVAEARELTGTLSHDADDLRARHALGWWHWMRFQVLPKGPDQEDLNGSIGMFTDCFIAGAGIANMPGPLMPYLADNAVGTAEAMLRQLIEGAAEPFALHSTADLWRRILDATPPDSPQLPARLTNAGIAFGIRFERSGDPSDLDSEVGVFEAAMELTPPGHPDQPARLSNLGGALLERYELIGAQPDLDAAIGFIKAGTDNITTEDPARAAMLSNLANSLRIRFERTRTDADLDAAIEYGRTALSATLPTDPALARHLVNLGTALRLRFERAGPPADLDAAIKFTQAGVDATRPGHPDRAGMLSNLGIALRERFELTGAHPDLDMAIEASQAALVALPSDQPDEAKYSLNLAHALEVRFERTETQADMDAVLSAYAQAARVDSAAPSVRIHAARAAGTGIALSDPQRAADLLETAVRLLPTVAPRELERRDQQYAISQYSGLPGDAAAVALANFTTAPAQRAARALGLLELGRAVLLGHALDVRSDIAELRRRDPDLAERFAELRKLLDDPEATPVPGADSLGTIQHGRSHQDRRNLAEQLAATLAQIRALDGFAAFALPPATRDLLDQAAHGPVVTVNVSPFRSDALLLTNDGITALELPGLAHSTLINNINTFHAALHASANTDTDRRVAQQTMAGILEWLWDVAASPILDALGYRDQPRPDTTWPRLWWAPGGLLGLLPIHAAGYHAEPDADDGTLRTVMDRVISSYTPTIRALRHARQKQPAPGSAGQTLIVAMPVTPGLPGGAPLRFVRDEVDRIRALIPDAKVLLEPDVGTDPPGGPSGIPTRANVLASLPGCSIAHFSCHGFSDASDPSQSLLLLDDYHDAPLTVAILATVNLSQAQLAYLSACRTAVTSAPELVDEAIHLTSAFQLAGFSHVIGTLWEIDDEQAATTAGAFYRELLAGAETFDAAFALHQAVRRMRDESPLTPWLWAGYLHAGG
jgi:tetratricopeptide (TPR) repeat protein